jgi:hypothetical protein
VTLLLCYMGGPEDGPCVFRGISWFVSRITDFTKKLI